MSYTHSKTFKIEKKLKIWVLNMCKKLEKEEKIRKIGVLVYLLKNLRKKEQKRKIWVLIYVKKLKKEGFDFLVKQLCFMCKVVVEIGQKDILTDAANSLFWLPFAKWFHMSCRTNSGEKAPVPWLHKTGPWLNKHSTQGNPTLGRGGKPPYKNETTLFSYMKKNQIFRDVHNRHYSMSFMKTNSIYLIADTRTNKRVVCVCKRQTHTHTHTER